MTARTTRELLGTKVLSQDGRDIGEVAGFEIDVAGWSVVALQVKLKRALLVEMGVKKPLVGAPTVSVAVEAVSGMGDSAILRAAFADLGFGEPTPASDG